MESELDVLLRVSLAALLGGLVGLERERAGKAAGLRTHMLVAAGAALFVGLAELLVLEFSTFGEHLRFDPIRVIEAVVAGVSFLGAGTIFFARREHVVHGLTTAASLWATAGLGLAAGLGRYVLAGGATLLFFVILHVLLWAERRWRPEDPDLHRPPEN